MNPPSAQQAGREAALLASKQFKGIASETKRRRVARARRIAETIWKRWSVGMRRWRLKHMHWYLTHAMRDTSPNTRYQYWVVLRAMLVILRKERWISSLRGTWCWPDGNWPDNRDDAG